MTRRMSVGRHPAERQVVARREADDAADTTFAFGTEEAVLHGRLGRVRPERREVVVEDERGVVVGVPMAVRPDVARAEIAIGEIGRSVVDDLRLLGAEPRPERAARGDQHPLVDERVVPAVRVVAEPGRQDAVGRTVRWHDRCGPPSRHRIHDHQLADLGTERLGRVGVDAGVGDEDVGLVEPRDRADADDAPLRVVRHDDEPPAGLDERPVRVRLEEVRAGEP